MLVQRYYSYYGEMTVQYDTWKFSFPSLTKGIPSCILKIVIYTRCVIITVLETNVIWYLDQAPSTKKCTEATAVTYTSLLSEAISKTQSCNMISGATLTRSLICVEIDRQVPLALILNAPMMSNTRKVWKEVASHCNPMSMPTSKFQWTITNTSVIAMLFLQTWF